MQRRRFRLPLAFLHESKLGKILENLLRFVYLDAVLASNLLDDFLEPNESFDPQSAKIILAAGEMRLWNSTPSGMGRTGCRRATHRQNSDPRLGPMARDDDRHDPARSRPAHATKPIERFDALDRARTPRERHRDRMFSSRELSRHRCLLSSAAHFPRSPRNFAMASQRNGGRSKPLRTFSRPPRRPSTQEEGILLS